VPADHLSGDLAGDLSDEALDRESTFFCSTRPCHCHFGDD
jgi:hypothetical protein